MPKFHFPLQPLLKIRRQAEQAAQRALGEQQRELVRLEDMLRTQQHRLTESSHALRGKLVGTLNVSELRLHAASALAGSRDADRIVLEMAGAHRNVDTARQKLLESRQKRMAIERLRERRLDAWQARLDKAENDLLDEIACRAGVNEPMEDAS
jgi:flagellar export protein FliJ